MKFWFDSYSEFEKNNVIRAPVLAPENEGSAVKVEITRDTWFFTVTQTGKKVLGFFRKGQMLPANHVHITSDTVIVFTPNGWFEIPAAAVRFV